MLKKFVSSFLCILLLTGCSKKVSEQNLNTGSSAESNASRQAAQLVDELGMKDSMKETKARVIKGMIFDGYDIASDASLFLSTESGNSDSVGVFYTDDIDTCTKDVQAYLENQKADAQTYNADQVFKISNAVIDSNDKTVVFVVCDDIEKARKLSAQILGK